jgi:hypothetical protein
MALICDIEDRAEAKGEPGASQIAGIVFEKRYPLDALLNDVASKLEAHPPTTTCRHLWSE